MPPISTMGLGRVEVSSERRVPSPPARITAFMRKSAPVVAGLVKRRSGRALTNSGAYMSRGALDNEQFSRAIREDVIPRRLYAKLQRKTRFALFSLAGVALFSARVEEASSRCFVSDFVWVCHDPWGRIRILRHPTIGGRLQRPNDPRRRQVLHEFNTPSRKERFAPATPSKPASSLESMISTCRPMRFGFGAPKKTRNPSSIRTASVVAAIQLRFPVLPETATSMFSFSASRPIGATISWKRGRGISPPSTSRRNPAGRLSQRTYGPRP
jgi:hypothetical protein